MIVMNAILEAKRARQRENYKRWYATAAGREKAIACSKAWSEANKGRVNAKRKENRLAKGDEIRAYHREYYAKNPEPHNQSAKKYREKNRLEIRQKGRDRNSREDVKRHRRDLSLWSNYRITLIQYEEMLARQGGVCASCRDAKATDVDHCHSTGVVRGILCHACNKGLGYFRDNPEKLAAAIAYLSSTPQPPQPPAGPADAASPAPEGGGEVPPPEPIPPEMAP